MTPGAAPDPALDPARCPLCGAANQCAMEIEKTTGITQPPCWCATLSFDAALIGRLPPASQGLACICARCAAPSASPET